MIPPIIHQIHLGEPMSDQVRRWTLTFPALNPGFTGHLWSESSLRSADIPFDELMERYGQSFASLTNALRLHVIHRFGGIYLDTDCECLKQLDPLLGLRAFVAEQDRVGGLPRYCNAVFGAEAGHPWITWQLENMVHFLDSDAATGVYLMTAATDGSARIGDVTVVPTDWFYPWPWDAKPERRKIAPDTLLIHHWKGSWLK